MKNRRAVGTLATVALSLLSSQALGVDVTTCGQVVAARGRAALVADLVCPASGGSAVILEKGASLDLAGHRLEISHDGSDVAAVSCSAACSVTSSAAGGAIVGTGADVGDSIGILVANGGRGRVANVRIEHFSRGVICTGKSLILSGVELTDNPSSGAFVTGGSLRVADSTASGNGIAFAAFKRLTARRTQATGNRTGLYAQIAVHATETTLTGNSVVGIYSWNGARAGSVTLRDSSATANGLFDILSGRMPRLFDSTCGVSHKAGTAESWSVCTAD